MPAENALFCREVTGAAEIAEIQALRYRIYVEEMRRTQPHADRLQRRLIEPLDACAIHVGAYRPSAVGAPQLVGAVRIHVPGRGDLRELAKLHPAIVAKDGVRTGVVSRLITLRSARGGAGGAGLQLAIEAYRIALRERLAAVEIDCHASLVGFFESLGFRVERRFRDEIYGDIALLSIRPFARDALAAIGSPLVPVYDDVMRAPGGADGPAAPESASCLTDGAT